MAPTLRNKIIRLANARPDLRPHLLPLLTRTAAARRMYTYEDNEGNLLWSYSLLPQVTFRRLDLDSNRGDHFRSHIGLIRSLAFISEG